MLMTTVSTIALLASLSGAIPTDIESSKPAQLEARQGSSLLATAITGLWRGGTAPETHACQTAIGLEVDFWHIDTKYGDYSVSACWVNTTATIEYTAADAEVFTCLLYEHVTTPYKCIGTLDSVCDNGYTGGGGRLQQVEQSGWCCPEAESSDNMITEAEFGALGALAQNLAGIVVRGASDDEYGGSSGGPFVTLTNEDHTESIPFKMYKGEWIGNDAC